VNLNSIRSEFKKWNSGPNKKLGQNFLIDGNIRNKILDASGIKKTDTVLEIGAGFGALTEGLCDRAEKVVAVEKDRRLCESLLMNNKAPNLEVVNADILDYLNDIDISRKFKVVGNLPYYISSPIITSLIEKRDLFSEIFVTIQKEFADRLVAVPGKKEYGSISCFTRFYTDPGVLFIIKRTCFYPAPKVDSSFVRFLVRETGLYLTDEKKMFKIIRKSFEKRRKTILNALCSGGIFESKKSLIDGLEAAGISPERRPETISLSEYAALTEQVKKEGSDG
jgi:16S rRNA (adenine1518-N6/adenine1519-N6)-dimethyltransferase